MSKKFTSRWFSASLYTYKYEEKKLFGTQEKEGISDRSVDVQEYADKLTEIYENLDEEGFEVVNVIPMVMGTSEHQRMMSGAYMTDISFSITRGAIVIGKKRE